MKKIIAALLMLSASHLFAQDNLEVARYDRAKQMTRSSAQNLVYNTINNISWPDNQTLTYGIKGKSGNNFYKVDLSSGTKESLTAPSSALPSNPNWVYSPDRKKAVYIQDWNLWLRDITSGKDTPLTTDGIENYGYATNNAGWKTSDTPVVLWSPDSKKIATFRQDQRHVSDMHLVEIQVGAPKLHSWKYPLPQDEKIIQIERIIIDTDQKKIIPLDLPAEDRRGTFCDDVACTGSFDDNIWSADASTLAFVSSTRDHKTATLRIADAATGKVKTIFSETVPTQYESGRDGINWFYLPESDEFIWYSERDDWGHLYLGDIKTGKIKNQITSGEYVVTSVLKIDSKSRKIYFNAVGKDTNRDPYFSQFYAIDFDGSNITSLTPEQGHHNVNLSPNGAFFVDTYSTIANPPVSVLKNIAGEKIMELTKADISELKKYGWTPPKDVKVKSANGEWDLYGYMFTPSDFDENAKYPVINYIYPGPSGGSVGNKAWNPGFRGCRAMAELGFVVIAIEGSCNPYRSKSFHDACYGDMSVNTLPDQVAGLKELAKRHPFLDLSRVGIWGRSGGGFASAAGMLRYPDFYKVGFSIAGNHDNRGYEDDWGERYNGLMVGDNYAEQANQKYASQLKGRLMLVTGGMDNNVPPYLTLLLADALIKANKDFDLMIIPHATHRFGEDNNYVIRRRWDYFVEHLMGNIPPKEYRMD